jgi:aryl-alcohol dehydrogenase-like predicted oxidoreductase
MEFRQLGYSGLMVPVLSFGTGTFGGTGAFFGAWGHSDVAEARRLIDICLEAGAAFFDTADSYSDGAAEEILGQAIAGRRHQMLISTKTTFRTGPGPNDLGSSRHRLLRACEASLQRLGTDYIDLYHMHAFDALTPIEEVLRALDDLVAQGKVRYVACSNFSGWHLMKSLAISDRYGWARYVAHQAYYSLVSREFEWELMPLGLDQRVATLVWSPLAGGLLSGKFRPGQPPPKETRIGQIGVYGPSLPDDVFEGLLRALDQVAAEAGKSVAQVALNWVLQRPTVASLIIGARNEAQLRDNLGAVGWNLTPEQVAVLDAASERPMVYPYWHQRGFASRNPLPVPAPRRR